MYFKFSGNFIVSSFVFWNAPTPMVIKFLGNLIFFIAVPANALSSIYFRLLLKFTLFKFVQSLKAISQIRTTPLGIDISSIFLLLEKARSPISITFFPSITSGIVTFLLLPIYFVINIPLVSSVFLSIEYSKFLSFKPTLSAAYPATLLVTNTAKLIPNAPSIFVIFFSFFLISYLLKNL